MSSIPHALRPRFQQDGDNNSENEEFQDAQDESVESSSPEQQIKDKNEEYETLDDLISKLNQDDHSQDEGIQDYIIEGYHPCHVGEVLTNRYVLIQKLGWGHFSTVWLAKDFKYSTYVAIKIMKSAKHYLDASYDQIEILQKVAKNALNPQWMKSLRQYEKDKQKYDRDDCHVLSLLNAFLYKGPYGNHFCMVFEILGVNLWQILKKHDCKGLPINVVKQITRQVLMGLDFLNRICGVIHTDLKPQNVLLCLTEQELKKIVEDEQLSSRQEFNQRLNYYRENYHLGPTSVSKSQAEDGQSQESLQSEEESILESELSTIDTKLKQLNEKLKGYDVGKNYQRTLKKKIKKLQEDRQKELQTAKAQNKKGKKANNPKKEKVIVKNEKKTVKQLFQNFKHKISFDNTDGGLSPGFKVKIADLGNACWEHHHFATQIQTRQYRSPEVLLGSKYNLSADIWSLACMTFQLLTGELLFNPKKDPNEHFGKNDDHLAQIMQLMGRFPKKMSLRGQKANKYISKDGCLNRIPKLQNWSMKDVMIAKYRFKDDQAAFFESFMTPMLNCYPEKRSLAQEILKHAWLYRPCPQQYLIDHQIHQKLRLERYDANEQRDEYYQYESENEDAEEEDNKCQSDQEELYTTEKVGEIKLIDRSYTDLGYIGFGTGIYLQKLDFGPNWQFE